MLELVNQDNAVDQHQENERIASGDDRGGSCDPKGDAFPGAPPLIHGLLASLRWVPGARLVQATVPHGLHQSEG
ncbi:hypothetical protein OHA74_54175 [Streptomyces phaeochromogenes]|uniref:hypothetical protein n=1 Tax=Streptomyces phaeochromogenes TaxID=1923 RepID=UPI002E2B6BAD|nr:hypothetical protein [Streptomyces phaeochromogenes]